MAEHGSPAPKQGPSKKGAAGMAPSRLPQAPEEGRPGRHLEAYIPPIAWPYISRSVLGLTTHIPPIGHTLASHLYDCTMTRRASDTIEDKLKRAELMGNMLSADDEVSTTTTLLVG